MSEAVGVDGCRGGWLAATRDGVCVHGSFAGLVKAHPADALIAVDMPIGLPERIEGSGRAAETAVRGRLGARQSSVFSIPARAAVEADPGPHENEHQRSLAHARSSTLARALSDPPRGVSRQGFMLFPKILEIDRLLRARPELVERVFESHPEFAFATLAGRTMALPKKVKGEPQAPGLAERRAVLLAAGLSAGLLDAPLPSGARRDDLLDACAMLLVAERRQAGLARPHPDPAPRDAFGLPIAIWA